MRASELNPVLDPIRIMQRAMIAPDASHRATFILSFELMANHIAAASPMHKVKLRMFWSMSSKVS